MLDRGCIGNFAYLAIAFAETETLFDKNGAEYFEERKCPAESSFEINPEERSR